MTGSSSKATKINLLDFKSVQMRAFHFTWITFFLCFFGWFGIAPLMPIVRNDLNLTQAQVGNIIIASVSITIFARLLIGWLCDKIGPRLCYAILLILGSIPVMFIGLSNSYESFLLFRLAIGVLGASFVVTQYHTSVMFAPNVVGTANATVAGWGNMGGGVTLMVMPLIAAAFVGFGYLPTEAWRWSMVIPGVALFIMGFIYYFYTQDTPEGNFADIKKNAQAEEVGKIKTKGNFIEACKDYRVWVLFLAYGACFGIEITIDNIAIFCRQFPYWNKRSRAHCGLIWYDEHFCPRSRRNFRRQSWQEVWIERADINSRDFPYARRNRHNDFLYDGIPSMGYRNDVAIRLIPQDVEWCHVFCCAIH
jgi:MFS transporter, NNP family, nitrate/nitrite transporter